MHKVEFPKDLIDRVRARTGRRHCYDEIAANRTALLVVDMQNYFVMPGFQAACPTAPDIVPNINRLADAVREGGGLVVWLRMKADREGVGWSVFDERAQPEWRTRRLNELSEGSEGFALWSGLALKPGDPVLTKTRYSAFTPGSSSLEPLLRRKDIDTVVVTGVATSTCCDSTARDAMMLNFRAIMVSDGCAGRDGQVHNVTLWNFLNSFGDVQSTDEVMEHLAVSAPHAARRA